MLKKISIASALAVALALMVVLPASANSMPTTGPRIGLFVPPATYPANTPFYVEHGFTCYFGKGMSDCANAGTYFVLYVDGVRQPSQVDVDRLVADDGTPIVRKANLTNFAQGLSPGWHTLTGVFYYDGALNQVVTASILFT
jgi:hypothetical protein